MKRAFILPISALCALSSAAYASEFRFTSKMGASYVNSKVDSESIDQRASDLLSLEPSFGASYVSRKFNASAKANFFLQERRFSGVTFDQEQQDEDEFFSNYDISTDLSIIDNVFSVTADAKRRYIPVDTSNILISDVYFGSDDLTSTDSQSLGFQFTVPNPVYFGLQLSGRESKIETDSSRTRSTGLDTSNTQLFATFVSGREIEGIRWEVNSSYIDTDGTVDNDTRSEIHQASVYLGLLGDFSLVADYQNEENRLSSTLVDTFRDLNYESWGLGFSWAGTSGRSIDLLYNESTEQDGEQDNFVSARINWPFSSRTSMRAEYGRRFFGESGSFVLSHNARHVRTRINYTESVSSFSRLISSEQDLGTFVCPLEATDIADCFQPDSLDYELDVGETFSNITQIVPEVSEQTTLRKGLTGSIGYSKRRFSSNLDLSRVESTFLQSNRVQTVNAANLSLSLSFGSRSSVTWVNRISRIKREELSTDDESFSSSVTYNYAVSRKLSSDISFRYLDRESSNAARDITDRRLTLRVTYKFD